MSRQNGFFITVEGGEGVGKTTFIREFSKIVQSFCQKTGREIILTREPGGTPTADLMRPIFVQARDVDPLDIRAEFLLVSAARAQHVAKLVKPKLNSGAVVLCDRFADSSRVYQGIIGGISEKQIEGVTAMAVGDVNPDLTFLLDADVAIIMERLNKRHEGKGEEKSRYDSKPKDFHEALVKGYRMLEKKFPERIKKLDASKSVEQIVEQAKQIFIEKIESKRA